MSNDREAVAAAVRSSPNLNVAASRLGASRRTLQNRMREYHMPRSVGGRPRLSLPHRAASHLPALATAALLGAGLYVAGRYVFGGDQHVVGGGTASARAYLDGTDLLISF